MHPENYPDSIMLINAENHCRIGDMNMKNVEVIGNIYENKTLIKRDYKIKSIKTPCSNCKELGAK